MRSYHEQTIRKYLILCTILGFVLILLWLVSCIWIQGLIAIILLFIILIVSKIAISIIARKTLLPVLFDKLDAIEFQKIVNDNRFTLPLTYQISSAISVGDYQTVVNIATKRLSDKKTHIKTKYYYLSILARAYFELRDFEKLKVLLGKYKEYNCLNSSRKFSNTYSSVWKYYQHFLEKNYEECKKISLEKNPEAESNIRHSKSRKLQNDFLYAVSCYENQEFEEAEKIFKSIISRAPKMYVSNISEKYLVAIERNLDCPFATSNIIPDSNFQIYDSKTASKIKRNRMIITIGLIIVAVSTIASSALDAYDKKGSKAIDAYETKLNVALQAQYDEYNLVDCLNLSHNNDVTDAFCIVEDEKGQCDIGFIVTYDDGNTFDFICAVNDIKQGGRYVVKSPTGMHSVAIDIGLKSGTNYDKKVIIAFDSSEVSIGFAYLKNMDF